MKEVNLCITILETIEIPDDKNIDEAVNEYMEENYLYYSDLEYEEVKEK